MATTYSLPSYQQSVMDKALETLGGYKASPTPAAVRQQSATQMISQDQPLQEAMTAQQGAVGDLAIEKLRAADQQLAKNYQSNQQAQLAKTQAMQQELRSGAQTYGADPQKTIASGPLLIDLASFNQKYAPTTSADQLLSPFVAEGIAGGEAQVSQDVYSLADLQRAARERIIGTESQAIADIYEYELAKKKEEEQKAAEDAAIKYETERDYAKLIGGSVVNPYTGKTEVYPAPSQDSKLTETERSLSKKLSQVNQDIKNWATPSDLFAKYAGTVDFDDLVTAYNANSPYGSAKESMAELRDMYEQAGGNAISDDQIDDYARLISSGSANFSSVPTEYRTKVAGRIQDLPISEEEKKIYDGIVKQISSLKTLGSGSGPLSAILPKSMTVNKTKVENVRNLLGMEIARLFEKGRLSDKDRDFYIDLLPSAEGFIINPDAAIAGLDQVLSSLEAKFNITSQQNDAKSGITRPPLSSFDR
jgi:hypothetical protein